VLGRTESNLTANANIRSMAARGGLRIVALLKPPSYRGWLDVMLKHPANKKMPEVGKAAVDQEYEQLLVRHLQPDEAGVKRVMKEVMRRNPARAHGLKLRE
jgi:hypothetical protein